MSEEVKQVDRACIWVDADACPKAVKDIVCRAAERKKVKAIFVANTYIALPASPYLQSLQVGQGFDVADDEIVQRLQSGDLLVCSDIPLADAAISKGALVLTPRGERWTANNIKARLNIRDFMETLRSSGIQSGGPPPYSEQDKKAFADGLDRILAKWV